MPFPWTRCESVLTVTVITVALVLAVAGNGYNFSWTDLSIPR